MLLLDPVLCKKSKFYPMKTILISLVFVVILQNRPLAQQPKNHCVGVYLKKSSLLNRYDCDSSLKNTYLNFLTGKVVSVHKNRSREKFPANDVFGYRNADGDFFRVYKEDKYLFIDSSKVCLYMKKTARSRHYYFSKGFYDEIVLFTDKNLRNFYDSATVKNIITTRFFKSKLE